MKNTMKHTMNRVATLGTVASAFALQACLFNDAIEDSKVSSETSYESSADLTYKGIADTSAVLSCAAPALAKDSGTLYFFELEKQDQGTLVPGVCGNGVSLAAGEYVALVDLMDTIPQGTVEFWFRPDSAFYNGEARTLLGNDGSRIHFFYSGDSLYFQKNHNNVHHFVAGAVKFKNDWNLIAGQWGDGYLSLFVNGKIIARIAHSEGYEPSDRSVLNENVLVIGVKSKCCMEGPGFRSAMTTSGAFDQVRISNVLRYSSAMDISADSDTVVVDTAAVDTAAIDSALIDTAAVDTAVVDSAMDGSLTLKGSACADAQINFALSDSGFVASAQSDYNMGGLICTASATYDRNTVMRSLFRFTLPDSMDSGKLEHAYFTLHVSQWYPKWESAALTFDIHKVLRPWNEGKGTSSSCSDLGTTVNSSEVNGVTAKERSFGEAWNQVGVGFDNVDADSAASVVKVMAYGDSSITFDVTELVRGWLASPSSNYGMILRNLSEASGSYYDIPLFVTSNDSLAATKGPSLKLTFSK